MKKVVIAGNIIVDNIKVIDSYPVEGMLSNIYETSKSVGGCVNNTIISLAKMQGDIELEALGKVGNDENGKYALNALRENGVIVDNIITDSNEATSYTDVLTVKNTGNRTFFHYRGASGKFSIDDVDVDALTCDIFHIGYLLLLDGFDKEDAKYGTVMAKLLEKIRAKGIKTSIDVVSENGNRFEKIIKPALLHCDYVIINEIEAGRIVNIEPRNEKGLLDVEKIKSILNGLIELGVKDTAIIHSVEGGFAMKKDGEFFIAPSLDLPQEYIVGSCGAGDAFCAGTLFGLINGFELDKALKYANLSAAANLSTADSIGGLRTESEIWDLENKFSYRNSF